MDGVSSQTRFIGVDALFQYAGSGVQLFSGLLFYLIAVRLFDTAIIGAIALFVAIIGLFSIVFSFGLSTAAQHFTSYSLGKGDFASVKKTIYKILIYGFGLSIAGFITLQILANGISLVLLHSTSYIELVRLLGVVLFGNILFGILNGILLGIQYFRVSAILNIIIWITYYFGALIFAIFYRSIETIVFGWFIGILLGVIIELVFVLFSTKKYLDNGRSPSNAYLFKYSFPILLSSIISYGAAYADRFVVSGLMNLSSLGIYNFALLIATAISFIVFPFNNILMPKFSEFFGQGEKAKISSTAKMSYTLLSYLYVPCALGIAALAPMILYLLGGNNYTPGAMPLRIIMFSSALFATQGILTQTVAAIRKTKIFLYSSAFALTGNVLFSILLIPLFGLIGAALGYSSVYAITFIVLYYFARKEKLISIDVNGIFKIWVSSVLMFVTVDAASYITGFDLMLLPLYVLLGIIVYIMLTKYMQIFSKENKEHILLLFPYRYNRLKKILIFLVLN